MLINLRATFGSGKSTVMRTLMARGVAKPIYGLLMRAPEAYHVTLPNCAPTFVLGPYWTPCGGCDAIKPFALIAELIAKYAALGHVAFEGALVSSGLGRIGELLEQHRDQAVVLFLDTPADVCVTRVEARRRARGDARPFDPRHLLKHHARIARLKDKLTAQGRLRVLSVRDAEAADTIIGLLAAPSRDENGEGETPANSRATGAQTNAKTDD